MTEKKSPTPAEVLADFTAKRDALKARIPQLQFHIDALSKHNTDDVARTMKLRVEEELSQTRTAIKQFDKYITSLQLMGDLPNQLRAN